MIHYGVLDVLSIKIVQVMEKGAKAEFRLILKIQKFSILSELSDIA